MTQMQKTTKTQKMQKTLHKWGVFYKIEKKSETELFTFCNIIFEQNKF